MGEETFLNVAKVWITGNEIDRLSHSFRFIVLTMADGTEQRFELRNPTPIVAGVDE